MTAGPYKGRRMQSKYWSTLVCTIKPKKPADTHTAFVFLNNFEITIR